MRNIRADCACVYEGVGGKLLRVSECASCKADRDVSQNDMNGHEILVRDIPKGFEIRIMENPFLQKGTGVLMLHPDDVPEEWKKKQKWSMDEK